MRWDAIIAGKIEAAKANGAFVDLPGSGQPLKIQRNPFIEPGYQLAFDLLQKSR